MAQQGNPDAFAALFNTHKAKVYSLCLRMTRDTAEAEDRFPPGISQARQLSWRFRAIDLITPCSCQYRSHAAPQGKAESSLPG
jgi:hypothetical protein